MYHIMNHRSRPAPVVVSGIVRSGQFRAPVAGTVRIANASYYLRIRIYPVISE